MTRPAPESIEPASNWRDSCNLPQVWYRHPSLRLVLWLFLIACVLYSYRTIAATVPVLVNGDFEQGTDPWRANTLQGTSAAGILSGEYPAPDSTVYAYVGDRTPDHKSAEGSVFQVFTVPANAGKARLHFQLNVVTLEPAGAGVDAFSVNFRSYPQDKLIKQLLSLSDSDRGDNQDRAYKEYQAVFDLGPYRNQQIILQFYAITDGDRATIFRVDNVMLEVDLVTPPESGELEVGLVNQNETSAPVSDNLDSPRFRLYFADDSYRTRDDENPTVFRDLPPGDYLVEGHHTGTFLGEEFWG